MTASLKRLRLVLVLLPCLVGGAALADASSGAAGGKSRAWKPVKFRFQLEQDLASTSNLFHLAAGEHDALQADTEPYERYHGMKGPSDLEARTLLDLEWSWKHRSKRRLTLAFEVGYAAFKRNAIADHEDYALTFGAELSKRDRLELEIAYTPERFRKNYADEPFPGYRVYSRADQRDVDWRLRYSRELSKRWDVQLDLSRGERRYAEPFEGRDRDLDEVAVGIDFRPRKRVALDFGFAAGRGRTPDSLEFGIVKDRSFDQRAVSLGAQFKLPHDWRLSPAVDYRTRSYTTGIVDDLSRLGREDTRWRFGLEGRVRLAPRWDLTLHASWTRNRASLPGADPSGDETGYRELVAGVGVGFRL